MSSRVAGLHVVPATGPRRRRARTVATAMLVAILVSPATARAAGQEPTGEPPHPPASIGVVGCSNTSEHVDGYLAQSDVDQLTQPRLGGLSFEMWGDPAEKDYAAAWRKYDSARPAAGYQAAWVQMCIRADDTHDPTDLLAHVVDQIRLRDPGIPVYVSPINEYASERMCGRIGPDGFAVGRAAVEWGVTALGIVAGPVTGPLTADMLGGDGCHLGPSGVELVGGQLVAWFDGAAAPTTELGIPALAPLCAAVAPLATVGVLRAVPACSPPS